jgi:predicted DNA-binding transcriptional regulator AlpA
MSTSVREVHQLSRQSAKGAVLVEVTARERGKERSSPKRLGAYRLCFKHLSFAPDRSHGSFDESSPMLTQTHDSSALLNEKEAARFLSMSYRTLQSWRSAGEGPPYLKLGRSIRYRRGDLIAWIDTNLRG